MKKTFAAVTMFGLSLAFLPQAHADTWSKRTTITVHEPIQVPGTILEPGKYVMKVHDLASSRHIVQISNEREDSVVATLLTIPHYRNASTDKTEFRFWEIAEGQPKPLRVWFYPGDLMGREFVYAKGFATRIAKAAHAEVPAVATEVKTEAAMETAKVEMITESGVEKPADLPLYAKSELPKSEPAVVEHAIQGAPEPAAPAHTELASAAPHYDRLPATASPLPLVGLASVAILGAGLGLRRVASRL